MSLSRESLKKKKDKRKKNESKSQYVHDSTPKQEHPVTNIIGEGQRKVEEPSGMTGGLGKSFMEEAGPEKQGGFQ